MIWVASNNSGILSIRLESDYFGRGVYTFVRGIYFHDYYHRHHHHSGDAHGFVLDKCRYLLACFVEGDTHEFFLQCWEESAFHEVLLKRLYRERV